MRRTCLLLVLLLTAGHPVSGQTFSLIIENGTVVDGTGAAAFAADVGIRNGRIAAMGDLSARPAAERLDATGLVVAPGFIDIHSHLDASDPAESPLGRRPAAENYIRQGVTTAVGGQDGGSTIDIGGWLAWFETHPPAVNVGLFVGHGSVRADVVGLEDRPVTTDDLARMKVLVRQAMVDGAFGLSSGLEYAPGMFADTEELVALASTTAPFGGLYISHVRDEGGRLLESVDEVIRIGAEAGVAAQLTHHKIIGKGRWGGTRASLARVDSARSAGLDISIDVYPYTASSTNLTILFPGWAKDGGLAGLRERLADPETRLRIRSDVIAHISVERGGDPATIVASRCGFDPSLDGLSLADIAQARGLPISVESAADIAIDLVSRGSCSGVFHSMGEEDVQRVMRHAAAMIASDGGIPALGVGAPHPRNYGTFARALGRYRRDLGTLSLEDAVRKITGLPAERLGLADRGVLRDGTVADVVVFDPAAISDRATFAEPHQYAVGVRHVLVGGAFALLDGEPTGLRNGIPLRRNR